VKFRSILAIESAVGDGSISVLLHRDNGPIEFVRSGASRAEKIIGELDELLRNAGVSKKDLDLIAVSMGPGSYSGIRIGVSTAFGLGHALGIPVTGVSVLEALAVSVDAEKVIAVVPIGKADLAWQIFESDGKGTKQSQAAPALASITAFGNSLLLNPDIPLVVPRCCFESVKCIAAERADIIDAGSSLSAAIARLGARRDENLSDLSPIYMRSAVAR